MPIASEWFEGLGGSCRIDARRQLRLHHGNGSGHGHGNGHGNGNGNGNGLIADYANRARMCSVANTGCRVPTIGRIFL